jgi:hypothetical protein
VVDFYETLRYEVKDEVGVTVATHGWVGGGGRSTREDGAAEMQMQWKEEREATLSGGHGQVESYARALVAGACRGDAYASWYDVFIVFRVFAPDVLAWTFRLLLSTAAPATAAPARPPPTARSAAGTAGSAAASVPGGRGSEACRPAAEAGMRRTRRCTRDVALRSHGHGGEARATNDASISWEWPYHCSFRMFMYQL